jgi:hypothetical protein
MWQYAAHVAVRCAAEVQPTHFMAEWLSFAVWSSCVQLQEGVSVVDVMASSISVPEPNKQDMQH